MPARRVPRSPLRWRTVLTVGFVLTLLAPALRSADGLPLSSYSMYAYPRSPLVTFIVPMGIDSSGLAHPLSTKTVAATTDPLIAESFLRTEVNAGRVDTLCSGIARRAGNNAPDLTAIEIRREIHQVIDRAVDGRSPVERQVLATCPIP